jgi:hypothetical protein
MSNIVEELTDRGHEVHVITNNYNKDKCIKIIEAIGATMHVTKDNIKPNQMLPGDKEANPGAFTGMHLWCPFIKEELQNINPDIAVVDFFTIPATITCDELGIPLVLNVPGPVELFGLANNTFPDHKNTVSCCGFLCIKQTWFQWLIAFIMGFEYSDPRWAAHYRKLSLRVVLINSFWGLDQSKPVPPNLVVTGPLVNSPEKLLKGLEEKDKELFEWCNAA